MAYSEYRNQYCVVGSSYYNYHNYCSVSYYDYSDCETRYSNYRDCEVSYSDYKECKDTYYDYYSPLDNYCGDTYEDSYKFYGYYSDYKDCETSYYNYKDCETDYNNLANDCKTKINYTNYSEFTLTNKGLPLSPALSWNSSWSGDTLVAEKLTDSISAIKNIRDNIKRLTDEKGLNTVSSSNVLPTSGNSKDAEFNDGVPETIEYVEDIHFNALRDTLDALYTQLTGASSGISKVANEQLISRSQVQALKAKTDDLAEATVSYSNVVNIKEGTYVDTYSLVKK